MEEDKEETGQVFIVKGRRPNNRAALSKAQPKLMSSSESDRDL